MSSERNMTTQKILSRDFLFGFLAQFAFTSAFFLLVPTLPIYLSRLEAKGAEIGLLIGTLGLSSLFLRPFVGRALLRIPERKFMIAGTVLHALACVAYFWSPPFWPLLIVRIFQGIAMAFFSTASFTLIANTTPEIRRGQIFSYYTLSMNFAFALAPYLGMLLINRFNFSILFLACTGSSLASLLATIKLSKVQGVPPENQSSRGQPILSLEALPASIMAFMLNVIWGSLGAFFPLYALGHRVSNPGIFFSAVAITLILGRMVGGKILDLYERKRVIIPCLVVVTLSMAVLTFSTTLFMFILAAVIFGTGWSLLYPSLLVYAIDDPKAARGPAMATFTALGDLGLGVGPMIMGAVVQWTSYPIMFSCLTLTGALNLFYFYGATRKKQSAKE